MYVCSVTLAQSVLLDPTNPTVQIAAWTAGPRARTSAIDGEFRRYAGDRVRLVTNAVTSRDLPIILRGLTAAQVRLVEDVWLGQLLLLRDTYGNRIYGSYLSVQLTNLARSSQGAVQDAALTFSRITYSDSV